MCEKQTSLKIGTVVVTYNRKQLLIRCLDCIANQTFKPHTVFIIDNASTDGTEELIRDDGRYYNNLEREIHFRYTHLNENTGGAGGFYTGMKMAYESIEHFDAVWVMDDDGQPMSTCLEKLSNKLDIYDYIAPLVLAEENNDILAFNYKGSYVIKDLIIENGIVKDYACPMNAILFSRRLIKRVGFPIPNLFIWGDEVNYSLRCKDEGFIPVTVPDAFHIHPRDRVQFAKTLFGKRIMIAPSYWREYCMIRNTVYNYKDRVRSHGLGLIVSVLLYQVWYYLFIKKDTKATVCCIEAFFSGYKRTPDQGYRKWMVVK